LKEVNFIKEVNDGIFVSKLDDNDEVLRDAINYEKP